MEHAKKDPAILSVKAFSLAAGIFWALTLFVMTLVLALLNIEWGRSLLNGLVGIYPYYNISVGGAFAGLIDGFLDGFIGCAIFAWLYNYLVGKMCK